MDEITRAAYAFIERFGPSAPVEAAQRAVELTEAGDHRGCDRWLRIKSEIETIIRESSGARKN